MPEDYVDLRLPTNYLSDSFSEISTPSATSPRLVPTNFDTPRENFYDRTCDEYINFTNRNPTTYHAINYFKKLLRLQGFEELSEREAFKLNPTGGLYFITRDDQTLAAFVIGGNWKPERGIGVVGSHADALTAKLKPTSKKDLVQGYELLGVSPYSGGLSHLWLDRDLGIAGAVYVKKEGKPIERVLVSSGQHPIARIPSLAPHFGSASKPPYNLETQMVPVIGFGSAADDLSEEEKKSVLLDKHPLTLLRYVARLANVKVSELKSLDLELFDVQTASRGGINEDFLFAPRVDDRLCSYTAVKALVTHAKSVVGSLDTSDAFSIAYLANNEEIGSGTRTGAKSEFLRSLVERVISLKSSTQASETALAFANSVILSADVTHLFNPNFGSQYLENHFPLPNKGLTVKVDEQGHYATDSIGRLLLEQIAELSDLTIQQFHVRNDLPCGTTIGPFMAVNTGARVVDVGLSQLSMHSIRATTGYKEVGIGIESFYAFFKHWRELYNQIKY